MTGPAGERVLFPLDLNGNHWGSPLEPVINLTFTENNITFIISRIASLFYTLPETINTEELTGTQRRREKTSAIEGSR